MHASSIAKLWNRSTLATPAMQSLDAFMSSFIVSPYTSMQYRGEQTSRVKNVGRVKKRAMGKCKAWPDYFLPEVSRNQRCIQRNDP